MPTNNMIQLNIYSTAAECQADGKLDRVGPVDNIPSTAEALPIGKIHPFSKIAVTL